MSSRRKPRVFVGSSSEQLEYARAVQEHLHPEFDTRVWDQKVFELSEYPLESLQRELEQADYGIFILAPDDLTVVRENTYLVPRDNVIFELGMFTGRLGRARTYILSPLGEKKLHLPTDLMGLTVATYEFSEKDVDHVIALGPACNKIRRLIKQHGQTSSSHMRGIIRIAGFTDFLGVFEQLIPTATSIDLYFIHSRRWREHQIDRIRAFLSKRDAKLRTFLPDLANISLIRALQTHFDDGDFIPSFIADAYRYFIMLDESYPEKTEIKLYNTYPTYSFYKLDNTILVAFYPTTPIHTTVPAFQIDIDSDFGDFLSKDIDVLNQTCRSPDREELKSLMASNGGSIR